VSETKAPNDVVVLTINGRPVEAAPGELVIEAAERSGTYIPRFCYHPRMEPVGMCRMCVVDIDTGRGPGLQPACMIPVAQGMVVHTESEATKKAQDGVLEFLLINHPLDCPVCDKGGECPLQDQTLAYGPGESRFVEEKRHHEKPIPISDLVHLDRERCILCDRCTRFAKDVAGDTLIHFLDRGNQTQVNTFPDHPFASYFSGNTVQICPVGALLATPYRFKARPWDLDQAESTCTECAVGCRIVVQSSRNEVLRYQGIDVDPVNWGWLCDKGRFSWESVNSPHRLRAPLVRDGDRLVEAPWGQALSRAAAAIRSAEAERVAVIGGARLTNEDAYAWAKLAKGVIGTDNVDAQLGDGLPAELVLGLPRATIDEACGKGGTVLVLAPDLKEELPVLFLRLRHAAVNDGVTVVEVTPQRTSVSALARASLVHRPGAAGEVVRALLAGGGDKEAGGIEPDALAAAARLLEDGPVTVILGRPSVGESADGVVDAAVAIHEAHPRIRFLSALRRGNVHGALDMGLAPGLLPGRVRLDDGADWFRSVGWSQVPGARGMDATAALRAAAAGKLDVLVLVGADPLTDFPDRDLATRGVAGARTVIAVDRFVTASAGQADIVLSAAGFTEVDGTQTNIEGRVSVVVRKVTPPGTARPDWMIASELARLLGVDLGLRSKAQILTEIGTVAPAYAGLTPELAATDATHDGVVVPMPPDEVRAATAASDGAAVAGSADEGVSGSGDEEGGGTTGAGDAAGETSEGADPAGNAIHLQGVPQGDDAGADDRPDEAVAAEAEAAAAVVRSVASDDDADAQRQQSAASAAESEAVAADGPATGPHGGAQATSAASGSSRPALVGFEAVSVAAPPPVDAYSLRLVATRKLYDLGTGVQQSPSLAGLAPGATVRLHPYDFDRLGVAAGTTVSVSSAKGSARLPVHADDGVPRGTAAVHFNQPGADVAALIDSAATVNDVRVVP
jgi:NADH-quinone oxidoreductase subunit G